MHLESRRQKHPTITLTAKQQGIPFFPMRNQQFSAFKFLAILTLALTMACQSADEIKIFIAGEPAKASEINNNFKIILDKIDSVRSSMIDTGYNSDPAEMIRSNRFESLTESDAFPKLQMAPNGTRQITAANAGYYNGIDNFGNYSIGKWSWYKLDKFSPYIAFNDAGLKFARSAKFEAGLTMAASANDFPSGVYSPDYPLLSIDELEVFAKGNGRLGLDFPSSQQAQTDGIDLYKFSVALMKRLEEQSLYIFELNRRLKALESKQSSP